ncbi:MAG: hypothetical protein AAF718_09785 [Pseudomonadota bacterium]
MADRRNQQIDLLNHQSEWGMTVSEAAGRKTISKHMLKIGAYVLFAAASVLAMPLIAGVLFFPEAEGMYLEAAIVVAALVLAIAFKRHSDKTERNSVQIDYRAAELRLGTQKSDGTFVREKVFSFRDIEKVRAEDGAGKDGQISIRIKGNDIAISFKGADAASIQGLASQITAAAESARLAPIRTRIQSKAHGLEASFREIKSRVQSRIAHA